MGGRRNKLKVAQSALLRRLFSASGLVRQANRRTGTPKEEWFVSTRTHSLHSASGEAIDDNAAETRKKRPVEIALEN